LPRVGFSGNPKLLTDLIVAAISIPALPLSKP